MAATKDQMTRGISPGSMPFGQRQAFQNSLGNLGPAGQAPVAGAAPLPGNSLGTPSNPLDFLAGGRIKANSDELTAGLSVGPGPGPIREDLPDSRTERLRLMSMYAKSPVLRELSRRGLNTKVREKRQFGT